MLFAEEKLNNVMGRKNNEFPHWEIQSSTESHDVRVSTDLNKLCLTT